MEELEDTIKGVLHHLENETFNMILHHLTTIGVKTAEDMEFVNENDLSHLLPPVDCRKLIRSFRKGTLCNMSYLS